MTDEEKNVIDLLKNIDKQKCLMLNCPVVKNNIERQLKIIELNRIIRKQSKEIEELKEDKYGLEEEVQIQAKNIMLCENALCEIQDKIKAKIEELEKLDFGTDLVSQFTANLTTITILQSLLEKKLKGNDENELTEYARNKNENADINKIAYEFLSGERDIEELFSKAEKIIENKK